VILGAVLAGGLSSRFGSDKALARLDGETLLDRAIATLRGQCDAVVVIGREHANAPTLPDWPAPGMGPLGGVAAALNHARDNGFDAVLTVGVDSVGLPDDLLAVLSPAPSCLLAQPVVGLWPTSAAGPLADLLFSSAKHSMRALAELVGAKAVRLASIPANINTPADLDAAYKTIGRHTHGL